MLFGKPSHFPYCILTFKHNILQTILCEQMDAFDCIGKLSNILGNKMCTQHDRMYWDYGLYTQELVKPNHGNYATTAKRCALMVSWLLF